MAETRPYTIRQQTVAYRYQKKAVADKALRGIIGCADTARREIAADQAADAAVQQIEVFMAELRRAHESIKAFSKVEGMLRVTAA
jgi:hypothetical protein